ncbi:MAG: alpha/beta hydrolase [Leptolyngbyaceae cyanobacterium CSU_1_3]|nr:alpha/beta hydrolase [Leptolyngbyaceae cyanobacterium CSU_1_3]
MIRSWNWQVCLWLMVGAIVPAQPAWAAEQVILKYGILRESVSVSDLTVFVEKGEASSALQAHLKLSGQNPEAVRRSLVRQVAINPILLDRILNSPIGNVLLDPLSQAIRTPRGGADRQALRAALTLSASGDGKLSILEVVQKYPTQELLLDGDRLVDASKRLSELSDRLQNPLGKTLLQK